MGNKIYGYCRCSTNESKQDVAYQVEALLKKGVNPERIRYEYISGRKDSKPVLDALIEEMEEKDILMVTDITRLARNTKALCEIIEIVISKKLQLVIGSLVIDARKGVLDPMIEGMLKVNGVFSEMEAKLKVFQIKNGLDNARKKGKQLGRPKTTYEKVPKIFKEYYPKYKSGIYNKAEFARVTKLSYPTIYKYIKIVENVKC